MRRIDFLKPALTDLDIKSAVKVLRSGWLTVWNPVVAEFEEAFAKYLGVKKTVVVSSGTGALHMALLALGIGRGDEVITTPLSWVASSNAILYVGARPVFVDVEPDTGLIDVTRIEKAVSKRTKAILPVHLYGQMADMRIISKIAKKYGLFVVEDACHAIESERDGVRPGKLSDAACFSFHAAKNITSGEGGAVVTNDLELAKIMRCIADSGVERVGGKRTMVRYGYKYSLTAFQSALLLNQLKRIRRIHAARKKVFRRYRELFKKINNPNIKLVKNVECSTHAYHIFAIRVPQHIRDKLRKALSRKGIGTGIHFNPIHLEPFYRKTFRNKKGFFSNAEQFGYSEISLPTYPSLSREEQQYVVKTISGLINKL